MCDSNAKCQNAMRYEDLCENCVAEYEQYLIEKYEAEMMMEMIEREEKMNQYEAEVEQAVMERLEKAI